MIIGKKRINTIVVLAREAYGPYKKQILVLTGLGFIGGLLEGVGINAVIPLISFVMSGEAGGDDFISQLLERVFLFLNIDFTVQYLLTLIVILFVVRAGIILVVEYMKVRIAADYEEKTRNKLLGSILRSDWPHLLKQRLGHLESIVMVDVPFGSSMLHQISAGIMIVTGLLIYTVVAVNISPVITLSTLILGGVVFLIFKRLTYKSRVFAGKQTIVNREILHFIGESISGVKTIKSLDASTEVLTRGKTFFVLLKEYSLKIALLQHVSLQAIQSIGILYIAVVFALSFKYGLIPLAALAPVVYLIYRMFLYVQQIQGSFHTINEAVPHLKSILEYDRMAVEKKERDQGTQAFLFERELTLERVAFTYPEQKEGIRDVAFKVTRGEMIGLIGPSGAGKTTLVDILLRLLSPTSGKISLDGVDIKDINMRSWRKSVGYVSQDIFLLNDTIANNIRFFDATITDADVREAARMANILDVIESLPQAFNTHIGERGVRLSAGQRQRVVIARVLARKPQLLILDEATSALDAESEAKIQKAIKELKGRITVIAVAHRLSTVMDSDELIVLKDGGIAESGTPEALLESKDSYFYKVNNILT